MHKLARIAVAAVPVLALAVTHIGDAASLAITLWR